MPLRLLEKPASKLVLRIYFFGLVQFAIVMVAMFVILVFSQRPPLPYVSMLDFAAETVAESGGEREQVASIVARMRSTLGCSVAIYDENDRLVAHDPRTPAPERRSEVTVEAPDLLRRVPLRDGRQWHLVFLKAPPVSTPPVLWAWMAVVIVGVGVFSLFIARSLVRPLTRLATAAREFGAGKLDARLHMERSDELGQVAEAFDGMADRVTNALRVEKELLANVSHELRTPLQRIHIAVELAAEGDADTARESLREIAEDLSELERIVQDVLTATRLSLQEGGGSSSASPPVRREPLEIRALIDKAATRFRMTHPGRSLRVEVADDIPTLSADPVLVRRVIDNLLDNADKYTEDLESEIGVVAGKRAGVVTIEVRDQGIGISPQDLPRLFEPFFRADRSRAKTTRGLGLGLALARRIIEAHGGSIRVESVLGSGTTVRVELPVISSLALAPG